jgi:hypothetical protein
MIKSATTHGRRGSTLPGSWPVPTPVATTTPAYQSPTNAPGDLLRRCSIDRWHAKPGVTMLLSINKVAA